MKLLVLFIVALAAVSCSGGHDVDRQAPIRGVRLHAEGTVRIPGATPVFGGISGIDRAADGTWYLLSDDRAARGPARFYSARLRLDGAGGIAVQVERFDTITDVGGRPFAASTLDPEALRIDPSGASLWLSSEGDETRLVDPFIREIALDGSHLRELALPAMFRMTKGATSGPRNNAVFEGLCLTTDERTVVVSTEGTLKQDGPTATASAGSPVRISFYDRAGGAFVRQRAYMLEPAPWPSADSVATENGVVEILARDSMHLLVLERGFSLSTGPVVRLFEADMSSGTDIARSERLTHGGYTPMTKRLVVDFATLGLAHLDNVEAMAWGEPLPGGERTLVFMSDDNFSPLQVTQVIVLAVEE
jgi:hypothetical protein